MKYIILGIVLGIIWLIIKNAAEKKKARQLDEEKARQRAEAKARQEEIQREVKEKLAAEKADREAKEAARLERQKAAGREFDASVAAIPRVPIVPEAAEISIDKDPDFSGVKFKNITKSTNLERVSDFVVVDVETTGLNPYSAEIVQLAAVRFRALEPVSAFVSYVKPKNGIQEKAFAVNGISEEMVKDAPEIESLIKPFRDFVGDKTPIVGHNLLFDVKFLVLSGCLSLADPRPMYDTLELSRKVMDSYDYKLETLCRAMLQMEPQNAHDALADAAATGAIFRRICELRTE